MLHSRLSPAIVPLNCEFSDRFDWPLAACEAWDAGERGESEFSRGLYGLVDDALPGRASMCPDLSVLRHGVGAGSGQVITCLPSEDIVHSLFLMPRYEETVSDEGLEWFGYDAKTLDEGIRHFQEVFEGGYHAENIRENRPHVFVMSTGRCGTVSLANLFRGSNLCPYHSFWFHPCNAYAYEFMCRLVDQRWEGTDPYQLWMKARSAEWLGDRPVLFLNHTDTIFAPVFAALHPNARFIYLHRNRVDTFRSFWTKDQYGDGNLGPLEYALDGEFRWRRLQDEAVSLSWYLDFTHDYARAVGRAVDTYMEISSDKLFAQDEDEIGRLLEFTGSDISMDAAADHFAVKFNEKAHKAVR